MASQNNYGHPNTPDLKQAVDGKGDCRTRWKWVAIDSSAIFVGEFVGTMSAPTTGVALGVQAWADNTLIRGYVEGFTRANSARPIAEDPDAAGTVTDATAVVPMKYTFGATQDRGNAAGVLERVAIVPILPGDILEVTLMNDAGTATADRGTTTGSDLEGYCLGVEAGAPYGAQESSSSTTATGLDFQIVTIDGTFPRRSDRVYVQSINQGNAIDVAQA